MDDDDDRLPPDQAKGRAPTQLMRAVLRVELPAEVDGDTLAAMLADAWLDVVALVGGRTEVLRVASAFDARWRQPLGPPPDRSGPGHAA